MFTGNFVVDLSGLSQMSCLLRAGSFDSIRAVFTSAHCQAHDKQFWIRMIRVRTGSYPTCFLHFFPRSFSAAWLVWLIHGCQFCISTRNLPETSFTTRPDSQFL